MKNTEKISKKDIPNTPEPIENADVRDSENTKIDLKKVTDKPMCVIIGPEGDFSEEERAKILKFSGVQPLKINENILRSETAVISAISIIKYAIN